MLEERSAANVGAGVGGQVSEQGLPRLMGDGRGSTTIGAAGVTHKINKHCGVSEATHRASERTVIS